MKSKHISRRRITKRKSKLFPRHTKMHQHRRSIRHRSMRHRSIRRGSMRRGSMRRGSKHRRSKHRRHTRRSFYKLKGGSDMPYNAVPGGPPIVNPPLDTSKVSLPQHAYNPDPSIPIRFSAQQAGEQNRMAKLSGGGSCIEGVPHGKILVPQFQTNYLDGNINANTNMVKLATVYAQTQTNAANDSLVAIPKLSIS